LADHIACESCDGLKQAAGLFGDMVRFSDEQGNKPGGWEHNWLVAMPSSRTFPAAFQSGYPALENTGEAGGKSEIRLGCLLLSPACWHFQPCSQWVANWQQGAWAIHHPGSLVNIMTTLAILLPERGGQVQTYHIPGMDLGRYLSLLSLATSAHTCIA